MGQWKPYKCIAEDITPTQSTGTTSEANTPGFRATGDDNEGMTYRVIFQAATTDTWYVQKSPDKATWTNIYAGLSGTDKFQSSVHSDTKTDFISIDAGVEMTIPYPSNLVTTDTFDITIPTLKKVYDGGIHGFVEMAFTPGTTEGSGIIYSENIPFNLGHTSSISTNSRAVSYTYNATDVLGNAGTAIDLQWTVDGTNYFDGFEILDDLNFSVDEDRLNFIAVYDRGDATGTPPKETGGDIKKYRLKIQFEDLEPGEEKVMGRSQFLHIAIYNH